MRNSAICLKCFDSIESKDVHDFVRCKCGLIAVDGGQDYLKRLGPIEYIRDTSLVEESSDEESDLPEKKSPA